MSNRHWYGKETKHQLSLTWLSSVVPLTLSCSNDAALAARRPSALAILVERVARGAVERIAGLHGEERLRHVRLAERHCAQPQHRLDHGRVLGTRFVA